MIFPFSWHLIWIGDLKIGWKVHFFLSSFLKFINGITQKYILCLTGYFKLYYILHKCMLEWLNLIFIWFRTLIFYNDIRDNWLLNISVSCYTAKENNHISKTMQDNRRNAHVKAWALLICIVGTWLYLFGEDSLPTLFFYNQLRHEG